MVIELNIKNDKLYCKKENIVAGCKNYYTLKAKFSEDWDTLDKFLTIAGFSPSFAFDKNNEVVLPPLCRGEVFVAVLGKKNDDIIAATHYHKFYVQEGAFEDYNAPPPPDDPATWATYLGDVAKSEIDKISNVYSGKLCGFTWYADTDEVVDRSAESYGKLSECMTDDFAGTWFYVITKASDKGVTAYPQQYKIDGVNGYLNIRSYVLWTGNRLVCIPVFEAKSSTVKNADGRYSPQSGVDGLYPSTAAAYNYDVWCRFIAAHQNADKNSGNDCNESGLYGNVTMGRPVSVIDTNTPAGNIMAILDFVTGITSQVFLGQTTETANSLHSDLWFKGNKENAQWLRALTSDNFIRFVNTSYTGYVNWAVAPGIYKVKTNSADGDRAFTEEHTMFVVPGAPEPDSAYLVTAKNEDRVKMREHAITQIAVSDTTGALKVRYCPLPNLNRSVSGKCSAWLVLHNGYENLLKRISELEEKITVLTGGESE